MIGLAFYLSLRHFGRQDRSLRLFSVLLGLTLLVECIAVFCLKKRHISNVALYNVFMLVEFWIYGLYFLFATNRTASRWFISIYLWVWPVLWYVLVIGWFGIQKWNSYLAITGSVVTIFLCVLYFYQLISSDRLVSLKRSTGFWIAAGLFFFYTCSIPYTGMLQYLTANYLSLARAFLIGYKAANCILYALIAYGFLWQRIITRK
jgi:hypothetical protein